MISDILATAITKIRERAKNDPTYAVVEAEIEEVLLSMEALRLYLDTVPGAPEVEARRRAALRFSVDPDATDGTVH